MKTENRLRACLIDSCVTVGEAVLGRRLLNRLGGFVYWRTRGENLDDPERNGEYKTLRALKVSLAGRRPVVVDVGANVGDWSREIAAQFESPLIYAVEPVAETFQALRANVAGLPGVQCSNLALSDRAGTAEIHVAGRFSGANSFHVVEAGPGAHTEVVTTMTGDQFCQERSLGRLDLVKIDAEGHEVSIFKGFAGRIQSRGVIFWQFEYNKTWIPAKSLLKEVFELFVPAGYCLCKLRPNDLVCYRKYTPRLENYCYSNWLIVLDTELNGLGRQIRIIPGDEQEW